MSRTAQLLLYSALVTLLVVTLIFAPPADRPSVLFVLLLAYLCSAIVARVLRHRRKARADCARIGLCPECGYDVRANSSHCSECGTVIERPQKQTDSLWDIGSLARRYLMMYKTRRSHPRLFKPVILSQIPAMDSVFLISQTADLLAFRMHSVGELQAAFVPPQAFRVFLSEDGQIVGSVGSLFAAHVKGVTEEVRYVNFRSELSDGTFVVTDRSLCQPGHQIPPPPCPGIDVHIFWNQCDASELLNHHRRRVAEKIDEDTTRLIVPCCNLVDSLVSQRRMEEKRCVHRLTLRVPEESAMRAAFPNRSKEWQDAFIAEVQRLLNKALLEVANEDDPDE